MSLHQQFAQSPAADLLFVTIGPEDLKQCGVEFSNLWIIDLRRDSLSISIDDDKARVEFTVFRDGKMFDTIFFEFRDPSSHTKQERRNIYTDIITTIQNKIDRERDRMIEILANGSSGVQKPSSWKAFSPLVDKPKKRHVPR